MGSLRKNIVRGIQLDDDIDEQQEIDLDSRVEELDINKEQYDVLVKTPMVCQNGHPRWLYHLISNGDLRTLWGPRECDCPTGEIGEGFMASGRSQTVLEDVPADYQIEAGKDCLV